ncbi:carbohydrate-binding family 9-like protein [bacterium]|nr:carbohydrate-binding family 9-like protein [bacterium]
MTLGKQYVDFLLRHKVNLSWTPAIHLESGGATQCRYIREVTDYARARGVHFVERTHSHIGRHPKDKDDPIKSRCVDHRVHKQYYCWSLLDLHEARARHLARTMKASGIHWLYLHATDGGGWENPARWNERCAECRRAYGDDHAKADVAVLGTWYRVMKSEMPDFRMIAVVYPYNAGAITPSSVERRLVERSGAFPGSARHAQGVADGNRAFLTRLGKMLPPDVIVCQREVLREGYARMTECYGRRGFQIYLEQKHGRGWNPEFTMASGWAKTFHRPGYEDVFYPSDCSWGHNYLSEMMSAEFGWNVNARGAREFTNPGLRSRDIDHHIEPRDVSRRYIERFCRDFYGPVIGPHMVAVYDSNISYRFIERPQTLIASMGIDEPEERMREMIVAVVRAWQSLTKARQAWDVARDAGREPILDPLAAGMFGEMLRAILVCRSVAPYQLRMLQARAAAIDGKLNTAKRLITEMREVVVDGKATWTEWWPWVKRIPIVERRNPNWVYTFGKFQNYDYGKLDAELARFEKEMHTLHESHNAPAWFAKAMRERSLYAIPARGAVRIDGRLDESAWQQAPQNEYFVDHETSTPSEHLTDVRVLYDAKGLYLAYRAWQPGADKIALARKGRDGDAWHPLHSVECFINAKRDRQTYTHIIWGINGSALDERRVRDGKGMLRTDAAGFTSKMRSAITRHADHWVLEAWIPADECGARPKPGAVWNANFCRNLPRSDGKRQAASTALLEGASFHTASKFPALRFLASAPPPRRPTVRLMVDPRRSGPRTIGDGTGYELDLNISVDTTKSLHAARLRADLYSGDERKGAFTVFDGQDVQLLWRSRKPIRHLVRTPEPGLWVDFRLEAAEGSWTFHRKVGNPAPRRQPAQFVEGVSGKALAGTAHFPSTTEAGTLFDSRQGTMEFWLQATPPLDTPVRFGPEPQHVLFCQSPVRHKHPLLDNLRSVSLRRTGRRLNGRVSTREYQQVSTRAVLGDWKTQGWRHVAMQWSAVDESRLVVDLYVDGRKASGTVQKTLHEKKWRKQAEPFVVQLGSMVTGAGVLGWPIDEVRVSSGPRYKGDFTPPRRAELDAKATVVFHFDGDLIGKTQDDVAVTAASGPGL